LVFFDHIVAACDLSRAAVSAAIMGNHAEAFAVDEKHLCVPIVGRQWPAVAEHDGLTFAPVFIIDVDVSFVFFFNSDVWHTEFTFG